MIVRTNRIIEPINPTSVVENVFASDVSLPSRGESRTDFGRAHHPPPATTTTHSWRLRRPRVSGTGSASPVVAVTRRPPDHSRVEGLAINDDLVAR